jgi:hypothetical protein
MWDIREFTKGVYEWPLLSIPDIVFPQNQIGVSPTGVLKFRIRFSHDKYLNLNEIEKDDPKRQMKTKGNILHVLRNLYKSKLDFDFSIITSDAQETKIHKLMLAG